MKCSPRYITEKYRVSKRTLVANYFARPYFALTKSSGNRLKSARGRQISNLISGDFAFLGHTSILEARLLAISYISLWTDVLEGESTLLLKEERKS